MRVKKLLICVLAGSIIFNTAGITALAAETTSQETTSQKIKLEQEDIKADITLDCADDTTNYFTDSLKRNKKVVNEAKKLSKGCELKLTIEKGNVEKNKYSEESLKVLSCLIQSEAGNQPYKGKLAVGYVVLNRMKSNAFPSSMKGVIYDRGQFAVTRNGSFQRELRNYKNYSLPSQLSSVKAAKEVLENGSSKEYDYLFFTRYSTSLERAHRGGKKISAHYFW